MVAEFIAWYLVLVIAGAAALPIARRLLRFLPDEGLTLAKPLGLLLWGFIFWLSTSLGLLQNTLGGVLFSLMAVVGIGLLSVGGKQGWQALVISVRQRTRQVIIVEVLFLLAFAFWAVMRAANPQISGTEKPMELAFINGILQSESFPPQDPWLSGYAISYYYFGYVIVAMLIRITGVAAGVGFNLAVASWFALTAAAAYGVLHNLLLAARSGKDEDSTGLARADWLALLAPIFLLIVSNLGGLLEVLHASGQLWQKAANGTWNSGFWPWLGIPELVNAPAEPLNWSPERMGGIWWWRASRVVQDFDISGGWREVIDEFPFFTYYLADLHPHLLAMPFALLAIGLGFNLYLRGVKEQFSALALRLWVKTADFWLSAVIFGALAFINTWNFPIYLGLFSAVFVYVRYRQEGWQLWERAKDLAGTAAGIGLAGIALYLPFYLGFSSQAGGILPSLSFFTRGVYFWIMFATLLVPIAIWLIWRWQAEGNRQRLKQGGTIALVVLAVLWFFSYVLGGIGLNLPGLGAGFLSSDQPGLAKLGQNFIEWGGLFYGLQGSGDASQIIWGSLLARLSQPGTWLTLVLLIAAAWGMLLRDEPEVQAAGGEEAKSAPLNPSPDAFVMLLVLIGAALTLVVEFIYLRDQFGTRMNTIFKFYFETWVVWSLAAGYASVMLWRKLKTRWSWVGKIVWVVVIACGLIYPLFAISETLSSPTKNWTLDGNAWFSLYYPDEQKAVDALRQLPKGVIVEAVGGSYTSAARFSTYTGYQTVLGWPGHESQWRGGGKEMGSRQDDIARLYRTSDWGEALKMINQYHIRYVVIASLERSTYKVYEAKFVENAVKVFQSGDTAIYEIPQTGK